MLYLFGKASFVHHPDKLRWFYCCAEQVFHAGYSLSLGIIAWLTISHSRPAYTNDVRMGPPNSSMSWCRICAMLRHDKLCTVLSFFCAIQLKLTTGSPLNWSCPLLFLCFAILFICYYTLLLALTPWSGMLYFAVQCHHLYNTLYIYIVVLCCAMLPDTIGSPLLVLHFEMLSYGMLCYAMLLYITTYSFLGGGPVLCHAVMCHARLCMLHHTIGSPLGAEPELFMCFATLCYASYAFLITPYVSP